jgi:hypothetical protein
MGENAAELVPSSLVPRRSAAIQRLNLVLVAGVLAAAVAWNQSLVHWRENVLDSYLFGYYGWRVAHGARPYLDVWDNKPPGIWWANALAFRVFGDGPQADFAVGSAALLATLAAFVGIATTAWHRSMAWPAAAVAALLLTNVTYECGANRTETLVAACETIGVCCFVQCLRTGRRRWLLAAGLALGAAPWCKQGGVGAAAGVALQLLWTGGRGRCGRFAWLVTGAALSSIAALSLLAWDGSVSAARFAILDFNRLYFEIGDASWWRLGRPLELYAPFLSPLAPSILLALLAAPFAGGVATRETTTTDARPEIQLVLWVWLLVTTYLVCVGVGRLAYHLMPLLPPLGLLLLQPLGRIAAPRGLGSAIIRRPSVGGLAVLLIGAAFHAAAAGRHDAAQCLARRPPDAGWLPATPPQYAHQAAEIQKWCRPNESVYVWGWSPGTYRFSYRANACRFGTLEKMGQVGDRARFLLEEVLRTLRAAPPAVLAISPDDFAGMRENPADPLSEWVMQTYEDGGEFEGMHLLHRR